VIRRLERRYDRPFLDDVNKSMKLIRYASGGYFLDVEEIVERERPPMIEIPEYRALRQKASAGEAGAGDRKAHDDRGI